MQDAIQTVALEEVATETRKAFPLSEYESLRSEIEKRLEMGQQMFTSVLIVAGTFLSLGFQNTELSMAAVVYPVIALFLASSWTHQISPQRWYLRRARMIAIKLALHLCSFR